MEPHQRGIVTGYLVRIWPDGAPPPAPQQSEMSCPESASRGQAANDAAEITAIREWARATAAAEEMAYRWEVLPAGGGGDAGRLAAGVADPRGESVDESGDQ